jgi:hypothetical protein
MKLYHIIVSEISQTLKTKYHIFLVYVMNLKGGLFGEENNAKVRGQEEG